MTWLLIWLLAWLALSLLAAVAFGKLLWWCNGEADDINAHVAPDVPPGYEIRPLALPPSSAPPAGESVWGALQGRIAAH